MKMFHKKYSITNTIRFFSLIDFLDKPVKLVFLFYLFTQFFYLFIFSFIF